MIVDNVDFSQLFESLQASLAAYLERERLNKIGKQLMENIRILADANLKCYQTNMAVIAEREKGNVDTQLISDRELQTRIVGERRVKTKAVINALLNSVYPLTDEKKVVQENWMSDDILYSVSDMIDRLTIERIKVEDYQARMEEGTAEQAAEMAKKIKQSQVWSERVRRYLNLKLQEIERKGFYECVEETRTYDLSRISDEQ